jgi:DNA-binding MarR family transcriptional regulator
MNNELYEKLIQLQRLLQKQHIRGWARGGRLYDFARGQGRILAFLRLHDSVSTRDISYLLGMAVSSLNEMLAKLEKGGYITREPSEKDRRIMLVRLTEKGKTEELTDTPEMGSIFACLTEEEQNTLDAYFDRIIAELEKKIEESGEAPFERTGGPHERFGREMRNRHGMHGNPRGFGYYGHWGNRGRFGGEE